MFWRKKSRHESWKIKPPLDIRVTMTLYAGDLSSWDIDVIVSTLKSQHIGTVYEENLRDVRIETHVLKTESKKTAIPVIKIYGSADCVVPMMQLISTSRLSTLSNIPIIEYRDGKTHSVAAEKSGIYKTTI
jgi:hypothetical protein